MSVLPRATPERLSTFSDGVFAVLITVLVLELRPPDLPTFAALLDLWPRWLGYAVSYLFIAIVWTITIIFCATRPRRRRGCFGSTSRISSRCRCCRSRPPGWR
ncbi:MAG TPA: TMEM175 family protein [Stellaceae bacterium]|nr:TMEM175 family protein [Stellaceae bacterium]